MSVAEVQLHHMARRHHATMRKLDGLREKIAGLSEHAVGTLETGASAWFGGLMNGKMGWRTLSLVFGFGFLSMDWLGMSVVGEPQYRHYHHLGNGFLASYVASSGYRYGSRLLERSKGAP